MAFKPDQLKQRPCRCGGTNPNCLQCGGKGVIGVPVVRPIMAGPAGIRRRLPILREPGGTPAGPPEPVRCPHCGLEVLLLAVHVTEAHPEQSLQETEAEREAREQEEARQAAVAAEIARREAEVAQRKAEARARRQAIEGPSAAVTWPSRAESAPQRQPPQPEGAQSRPVESVAPAHPTAPAGTPEGGAPGRERGPTTARQPDAPRTASRERSTPGAGVRPAEGPMALAFRLAREKKKQAE